MKHEFHKKKSGVHQEQVRLKHNWIIDVSIAIQKQKLLEGVRTKPFSAVATNCRSLWLEVNKAGSAELRQPALAGSHQMSSVARPMLHNVDW